MTILLIILLITTLLSISTLIFKAYCKKDWGIIGSVIPRVYLFVVTLLHLTLNLQEYTFFLEVGITLTFLTDFILSVFNYNSRKFKEEAENRRLVNALKQLESKYMFVVENSPTGIYVIDGEGKFEFVNRAFCELSGYTRMELLSMTIYQLINKEYHDTVRKNVQDRIQGIVEVVTYKAEATTRSGKVIPIKILGKRTENGHVTITGSIILLEE